MTELWETFIVKNVQEIKHVPDQISKASLDSWYRDLLEIMHGGIVQVICLIKSCTQPANTHPTGKPLILLYPAV